MLKAKRYILLYLLFLLYSISTIFSKLAAQETVLSLSFIVFYGVALVALFAYAIFWQQILRKFKLSTAYANKAVVIVFGMVWGRMIFGEMITINKIVGAVIIMAGVCLVVKTDE